MRGPTPEPCCPKCERIARTHGWTVASGMSVRAFMETHGLTEDDEMENDEKPPALPNDFRTATDLDAHLRAKGVRTVTTTLTDDGRACVEAASRDGSILGHAHGETASHAFDAMLGALK